MPHLHAQLRLVKAHQHVDNVKPRGRLIFLMDSSNECTQGLQRWEKEFFLERKSQNVKGIGSVASHCNLRTFSLHSIALFSELQNTVWVLICAKSRNEKRNSNWNCCHPLFLFFAGHPLFKNYTADKDWKVIFKNKTQFLSLNHGIGGAFLYLKFILEFT